MNSDRPDNRHNKQPKHIFKPLKLLVKKMCNFVGSSMFKTINKNILFGQFVNKRRKPDRRNFKPGLTDGIF